MVRNSDLTRLRNEIKEVVRTTATPREQQIWDLHYEEGLSKREIALILDISTHTVDQLSSLLRKKVLKNKPYLLSSNATKYKGATRIINMLATECKRKDLHASQVSFQEIQQHINDIIASRGTDKQKNLYRLYFVEGLTQVKIGQNLHVIQPTIQRSIWGNFDSRYQIYHGGLINKIGKHLRKQEVPYCCSLVNTHGKMLSLVFGAYRG